jgi:aspartate-semialdehyde dehydrogenase
LNDLASQFDLAVLGVDAPLGVAVLAMLDEHEVPIGRLFALTLNEPDASASFQGEEWPYQAAAEFDFSLAQALVVTCSGAATARLVEKTRGLFNLESPEPETFPLQIAFNVVPKMAEKGATDYDTLLAQTTARLANGASVGFTAVTGPLFFGAAMALHVRTEQNLDIEKLRNAFNHQDGITLMEVAALADTPAAMPTPATDAQGSQNVFVGRIQIAANACRLWLVFDPITLEAAQIATTVENWIDKPVTSMLT